MNYIYLELKTSGASPLYSRITGISFAGFCGGKFRTASYEITGLSDEIRILSMLSGEFESYDHLAYPDDKATSYLNSCLEQYCLPCPLQKMKHAEPSVQEIISAYGECAFESLKSRLSLTGELKHFYPDYKNYYFLPAEDQAVHKSVAQYADKAARIPASTETAYTKMAGIFIPASPYSKKHIFRTSYHDPEPYILQGELDPVTCLHLISHRPQDA